MSFPLTKKEHDYIETRIQEVPELIVAAAVRYGHQIMFVERPGRHHDSFVAGLRTDENYDCGFVTSRGRFVSRKEAGEIVLTTGQGSPRSGKSNPKNHLFSEDMWHDSRFEGDFASEEYKQELLEHYNAAT
jgi:hypothetical protein